MSKDSDRRRERKRASWPTLVSLFAGAGGLDLGLELAGFTTLFANEVEEHTCRTLVENQRLSTLDARGFNEWFDSPVLRFRAVSHGCGSSTPARTGDGW